MNSDLLTRWTAIITNIAVVIGLVFVGLEFRNNSRAIEAERVESFLQGVSEITLSAIESEDMSEIIYQMYAAPDSLTGARLDRVQHQLLLAHNNFRRMYLQHEAGLLPDEMFEYERRGIGFSFSSDIGLDMVAIFRASTLGTEIWDIIEESAKQARDYCLNPQNACVARYEAARDS
jgi:hypothetical protein